MLFHLLLPMFYLGGRGASERSALASSPSSDNETPPSRIRLQASAVVSRERMSIVEMSETAQGADGQPCSGIRCERH